jgi:hypothetical protein
MHREFEVHRLNPAGVVKAAAIAEIFDSCLSRLEDIIKLPSRELSIVCTKLEEASFFAKKALASIPENQQPEFDLEALQKLRKESAG